VVFAAGETALDAAATIIRTSPGLHSRRGDRWDDLVKGRHTRRPREAASNVFEGKTYVVQTVTS